MGRAVRRRMRRVPIIVEMDLEPDEYYPRAWGRTAWEGVWRAFQTADIVRDTLGAMGQRARFSWGLRLDPQIAIGEGRPDYILSEFENEIAAARRSGDSFGPHPHWFRLRDGDWVEDTIDAAWVQHCIGVSLDAFRAGFGTPTWIHFGQSWMDQACFNRAMDEGIRLVLTPEPGMKIEPADLPGPPFLGTYSEYPSHLRRPYWGSREDFCRRGLQRRTIIVPRTAAPVPNPQPGRSTHTNCWVSDDKTKFQAWIQQAREDGRGDYLVLAGRSNTFRNPEKAANFVANLTWLVTNPDGPQGVMMTPEEAFLDG
jgi:hypothetical protein